ncbi:MAG: helix-turn-helix domain-containing protein [Candidatus Limnocylindria bacterium]
MTRKASVHLRTLTRREKTVLQAKLREVSLPARLHRRYRVIAELRSGHPVTEAARAAGMTTQGVYELLHRFNDSGFASFERPNNPRGRVPILSARQLQDLVDTALTNPAKLGLPFTGWSVRTLTEYCQKKKLIPPFSQEWVRRLLRRSGLSAQRIRTWKHSEDPQFAKKGDASAPSSSAARRARRSSASTSGARSSAGR